MFKRPEQFLHCFSVSLLILAFGCGGTSPVRDLGSTPADSGTDGGLYGGSDGLDAGSSAPDAGSDGPKWHCSVGEAACDGICRDLQTDSDNCGACANACGTDEVCTSGKCTAVGCSSGENRCGSACVDMQNDDNNCGACGNVCTNGDSCHYGSCVPPPPPPPCGTTSEIDSNFNGTSIAAGDTIWFSAVLKTGGLSPGTVITLSDSTITFSSGGQSFDIAVPGATVKVSSDASEASTYFDKDSNTWVTVTPPQTSGNTFLTGVALPLTEDLPGGANPVAWTARFSSNIPDVSFNWQWAAAVYTQFVCDYNDADVSPTDDSHVNPYCTSDHAGTPEAERDYVIGGARGGGGSNFTGSLSPTGSVSPPVCTCSN